MRRQANPTRECGYPEQYSSSPPRTHGGLAALPESGVDSSLPHSLDPDSSNISPEISPLEYLSTTPASPFLPNDLGFPQSPGRQQVTWAQQNHDFPSQHLNELPYEGNAARLSSPKQTGLLEDILVRATHQPSYDHLQPHLYQGSSTDGQLSDSPSSAYNYAYSQPPNEQALEYGQQQQQNNERASWQPQEPSSPTHSCGNPGQAPNAASEHSFARFFLEPETYPPRKSSLMPLEILSQAFDRLHKIVWKYKGFNNDLSRLLCQAVFIENVNSELANMIIGGNEAEKEAAVKRLLDTQGPANFSEDQRRQYVMTQIQVKMPPHPTRSFAKQFGDNICKSPLLRPMLASDNLRLVQFAIENFPISQSSASKRICEPSGSK